MARGTHNLPELPFTPNQVLHLITYDFCESFGDLMDGRFANTRREDLLESICPAKGWGSNGYARREWRKVRSESINVCLIVAIILFRFTHYPGTGKMN